jgi:hypothetical protein
MGMGAIRRESGLIPLEKDLGKFTEAIPKNLIYVYKFLYKTTF